MVLSLSLWKIKGWVQINTVKACYNYPMAWNVRFFQTIRGDYPVKKFIEEQNLPTIAKITHYYLTEQKN